MKKFLLLCVLFMFGCAPMFLVTPEEFNNLHSGKEKCLAICDNQYISCHAASENYGHVKICWDHLGGCEYKCEHFYELR